MSVSAAFIRRPIATTLLTIAVALSGVVAFKFLPVSPLPQVDFPTIQVQASLPGASPEIMASAVATPLERSFGRIAGVTEMTAQSTLGQTSVTLQFDLGRNVDAAARDVEAAINAARSNLPADLPSNPTYRKVNPADSPIMIVALTSDTMSAPDLYDVASTVLSQRLAQIEGVGQVFVGGSSNPAVRIDVNPTQLNSYGIQLDNVRMAIQSQTANLAKGSLSSDKKHWSISANDQLTKAADYAPIIVSYQNGAAVRLSDVATVTDSVQTVRSLGLANGNKAALLLIFRQPGANIIDTIDSVKAALPRLKASVDQSIKMTIASDQSVMIRASVNDVERSLFISIILVILVVFIFLREVKATLIPSVAVPVSLIGTLGFMYLFGYSIDNLSLMALTISTGFVVDDAIVVLENITRFREQGYGALEAAYKGAAEISSTVISMSISLVAVFTPILLMGGIVGRLFREFAVVLSITILVSLIVSLTATPMMCSRLKESKKSHGKIYQFNEQCFNWFLKKYEIALAWVLEHSLVVLFIAIGTLVLNIYLYAVIPKGFFPQQDTGRITGNIIADQSISFQAMSDKIQKLVKVLNDDPAVDTVIAFCGGGGGSTINTGRCFVTLKPIEVRKLTAEQVINRLRPKLASVPGVMLYMQAVQDVRIGGRPSAAQYQYTVQSDNLADLTYWAPELLKSMRRIPQLMDVNTDAQNNGLSVHLDIDRATAARMGISAQAIDNLLYDAFGERPVALRYTPINQYFVVLEAAPQFLQSPDGLNHVYVNTSNGTAVPLSAFAKFKRENAALSVNHSGVFPSATISFNLAPGVALGDAVDLIEKTEQKLGVPNTIHGAFGGTAQAFSSSLSSEPILILAALVAVYIVLGMLYESFIHPVTILSTLPSAGVGALLALIVMKMDLSLIGLIGIILLIGLVKKNAIMMIDFALEVERRDHATPRDAIFQASLLRFRPIMMTTMAALLGGLPLALGTGMGSELRKPLGVTIVGGLIVSQSMTLFTTPVIYLYMDRLNNWFIKLTNLGGQKTIEPELVTSESVKSTSH
jgi:multidrug efflux pump